MADPEKLKEDLDKLKRASVDGVMIDCWWGIVEGVTPQVYDWSAYYDLFSMVRDCKLKLQVACNPFLKPTFLQIIKDFVIFSCSNWRTAGSELLVILSKWSILMSFMNDLEPFMDNHPVELFWTQAIMSFHQCGGNVGDDVFIPLPAWVLRVGKENPDIFFTNRAGVRNPESLTFGIDDEAVLDSRTALEVVASLTQISPSIPTFPTVASVF